MVPVPVRLWTGSLLPIAAFPFMYALPAEKFIPVFADIGLLCFYIILVYDIPALGFRRNTAYSNR